MKPIDTKTHGYIDYIMGIILIAVPFLLKLNVESTPSIVLFVLGAGALVYSILTQYELGLVKLIPMNIHLMLDIASGIFLAASPWLLGFSEVVYLPHLILGLLEIGVAVMTNPKPRIEL
ncbi:SPW repeat-containing protein [Flavobacterium chryseum]|uniref:SPW repeat domain-containing protein n=1 Tax=Flavobacterium sp. P3160 TaxID=2512113 RepID=UPI00105CAF55|nr:SPW repeat protein [Flavobacterium sp. P3160]TDO73152.1 SPW repeat-containing protein [Flavobacterium sp. P3160]